MLRDVILSLTRAQVQARIEQRFDEARRIGRGIAAMLTLDADDDDRGETKAGGFDARGGGGAS